VKPIARVAVVVPAHNEGALIGRCLASLRRALAHPAVAALDRRVVVVADRCADDTAAVARRALARGLGGTIAQVDFASAGRARAEGVARALARWPSADPATTWLANTDADTWVPADWLARQLQAAARGYAAVAGIVDVDSFAGHAHRLRLRRLFRSTYEIPEDRPHPHVHGCNLGVRGDAYLDAGGWPATDLAEDHGLWNAIRARGWRCLSDRWLRVITSGRPVGRARGGFADTLVALGAAS
jgi:glycosyltransferase involved in cell wall biosynthesis